MKRKKMNLSENAKVVLEKRYLAKDEEGNIVETPEDMIERVARAVAEAEKNYGGDPEYWAEKFYDIMAELKFLPNSPTLMNAGRELGQLSACFVLPVEDSMEGIFDAIKNAALIHKSGGGTGMSFSRLRPKGALVRSTGGEASGPVSFMKVFNSATEAVKQGGRRRGANMGILRVDHPDILEFIRCKEDDRELTNFNISVAVTDKFMEALKNDETYELVDPNTGRVTGRLKAREVFDLIVEMAWKNGEPGVIFIDRINAANPTPHVGQIESTNPCVTGDTLVFTDKGWIEARNLKLGMKVWNGNDWNEIKEVINNGIKPIVKIKLKTGLEVRVTEEHKIMTKKGWKQARELEIGDEVFVPIAYPEINFKEKKELDYYELLGYFLGDGSLSVSNHVSLQVGSDKELAAYFEEKLKKFAGSSYVIERDNQMIIDTHKKEFAEKIRKLFKINISESKKKKLPPELLSIDTESMKALLRGIFSSDGTVYDANGSITIALSSSSLELLKQVQILLLSLGIPSVLTKEKDEEYKAIKGREYESNATFRIIISGERARLFFEKIGFIGEKKQKFLSLIKDKDCYSTIEKYEYQKIVGIEPDGEEEVFDITAPPEYTWITNGILSLDCGEQPLLPFESCNLGSINLCKFVKTGSTGNEIDFEGLKQAVHTAVRLLDDVIDVNKYPLNEIERMTKANRKIGLGVMGFADMLIKLGIPYDSEEALKVAEAVMGFIQKEARKASEELAEIRGAFPNFAGSVYDVPGGKPLRNATVTTIAPTGSISIIAGCSSGIEPVFALAFERNVLDRQRLIEVYPLFEEEMKRRGLYSKELMEEVLKEGSLKSIPGIPEDVKRVFVTAHEISPEWHVRIQAAFQKYTDNAVSKTVNFPNSATREDVKKVYLLAYELGCKGVTVYRDGSREEQVLKKGTGQSQDFTESTCSCEAVPQRIKPRPRPSITYGSTEKVKIGCGNLYITVNSDEHGICEVFTNLGRAGGCPSQSEATSRLISLALRSGIDVRSIVEQLKGIRCHSTLRQMANNKDIKVLSCPDAIARAIERHIGANSGDGTNGVEYLKKIYGTPDTAITLDTSRYEQESEKTKAVCPECKSVLEHDGGCVVCRSCGYSKCN
ncbi:MAG: ribonucleoside-diphosphate reductase alpha chain [Tepidanaerobacteraceae bacterium]|nr:ribonucleoside-diphosphate reductase alpha chain [Tepidanaerobacteraceae bacterium]